MSRVLLAPAAVAILALALPACRSAKPLQAPSPHHLELSVVPAGPASLPQGTLIRLSAAVAPATEMAWVSGTVKILGAKVLALKLDPADKLWKFRTMVPLGITVPHGSYELRAWGSTVSGEPVEGSLTYEVK